MPQVKAQSVANGYSLSKGWSAGLRYLWVSLRALHCSTRKCQAGEDRSYQLKEHGGTDHNR